MFAVVCTPKSSPRGKKIDCQFRYGLDDDQSFPINVDNREAFAAALAWVAAEEREHQTWYKINNDTCLFVYPDKLSRESDPRQRQNGRGEISPVSFKRKLRDLLEDKNTPFWGSLPPLFAQTPERYDILELRGRKSNKKAIRAEMCPDTPTCQTFDEPAFLNSSFVKEFWDARVFGNTFLEKDASKGFIKTGSARKRAT